MVQEGFIRVWEKRRDWTSRGTVSAYLYRIVRNLSLNDRRDRKTAMLRNQQVSEAKGRNASPRTPADTLEAACLRAEVEAAITSLPERRREIFILSRFHGLTHRDIAAVLELSTQTVANQMSAALAELRDVLRHLVSEA